jgi:hypothetical protein
MINQATIKAGVEAAKKGIPMAGQKLADFFSKEGIKQAGNVAKETAKGLYERRGEIGRELKRYATSGEAVRDIGSDLTAVGQGIMKGPEAIKAGAAAVGDVASQATARVGKEAVRAGIRAGGKSGGQGVKNLGRMAASPYAVQTGIGVAAEQLVPRIMGQQPRSGLGESFLRQGVSQGIGMPVSAGLMAGGVNPSIATFGGQVAGQIAGAKATDAFLPGKQDYPVEFGEGPTTPTGATKFTAEPESAQVVRPSTTDLSGVQAREALSEREKYEYRLKMAQIEKMPSTVMHMSPDSNNQTLASLAQSMMRSTSY